MFFEVPNSINWTSYETIITRLNRPLFLRAAAWGLVVALGCAQAIEGGGFKTIALGFELSDRSLEGELHGIRADESHRLRRLSTQLESALRASPLFDLVDGSDLKSRIKAARPFQNCVQCEVAIAREAGARMAIYGVVEKISNLILDIRVVLIDTENDRVLFAERVGIRGNTDYSWQNGLRWLLQHRLLAQ